MAEKRVRPGRLSRWLGTIAPIVAGCAGAMVATREPGPAPRPSPSQERERLDPAPSITPLAAAKPSTQTGIVAAVVTAEIPADNPGTPEKIELGKKLFFDVRLSANDTVSCATCHDPEKGFTDHKPTSVGIMNQIGKRNSPSVLNAMFFEVQFWDGRAGTLEDQAKLPILNPIEMGQKSGDVVAKKIAAIPEYTAQFQKVFGRAPTYDDLAKAIAAYERTQVAMDSPFDRFLAGDEGAIDAAAKRGWSLFNGKGRCMSCHGLSPGRPVFSDLKFHNIGIAAHKQNFVELARKGLGLIQKGNAEQIDRLALETDLTELGRFLVTKYAADIGAFKTMGIRNLLVTQPYFHDGSQETLWDVMDHYNKGGIENPFLDGGIQRLGLTEDEIDDFVALFASLTSSAYREKGMKELERQRALSKTKRPERDVPAAMGSNAKGPGIVGPFGDPMPTVGPQDKDPAKIGGHHL